MSNFGNTNGNPDLPPAPASNERPGMRTAERRDWSAGYDDPAATRPPALPQRVPKWGEPGMSAVGMGYPSDGYPESKPAPSSVPSMSHLTSLYGPQALEQMYKPSAPARQPEVQIHISVNQQQQPTASMSSTPSKQYMLTPMESTKHQKKVYFPLNTGINYIGLLIGPKGMYQKKLEEQTGCKILIRGRYTARSWSRGSQKDRQRAQSENEDEQHVLVKLGHITPPYR